MADDIKLNRFEFSLKKQDKPKLGAKPSFEGETAKSSYHIPVGTHRALRMLSVKTGKKLNVLIEEAINDLLSKYGE